MATFRFRMERLLRVRKLEEEISRSLWLAAMQTSANAQARVERVQEQVQAAEQHLRSQISSSAVSPAAVLSTQSLLIRVWRELQRQRENAKTAAFQAEQQRLPWQEKRAEAEGLDRLRSQKRKLHLQESDARELELLDEIASRRHSHPNREASSPDDSGLEVRPN